MGAALKGKNLLSLESKFLSLRVVPYKRGWGWGGKHFNAKVMPLGGVRVMSLEGVSIHLKTDFSRCGSNHKASQLQITLDKPVMYNPK